ncbi:MAG: hypothetical protein M0Z55_13445 [Peptococcaceae bacterium]|nr:hypothetical protein [Peptococcaceae bacterium]
MLRIIIKAVGLVTLGATLLLFAAVWGQNQATLVDSQQLLKAGILGTVLIVLSLVYSVRKKFWHRGRLSRWLQLHELAAISGTAIILWHTGLRIHNLTGWLAIFLLLLLCTSGMIGRYVHMEISRELARRKHSGETAAELQQAQWWRNQLQVWHKIHVPLTAMFLSVLFIHIVATVFYVRW